MYFICFTGLYGQPWLQERLHDTVQEVFDRVHTLRVSGTKRKCSFSDREGDNKRFKEVEKGHHKEPYPETSTTSKRCAPSCDVEDGGEEVALHDQISLDPSGLVTDEDIDDEAGSMGSKLSLSPSESPKNDVDITIEEQLTQQRLWAKGR